MRITKLLNDQGFDPEDVERLSAAFESCLVSMDLKDRNDPLTILVARLVINLAREGVSDPAKICESIVQRLGNLPREK